VTVFKNPISQNVRVLAFLILPSSAKDVQFNLSPQVLVGCGSRLLLIGYFSSQKYPSGVALVG
jgi:hypothetical protein